MGSMEHELSSLSVYGSIVTNGESYGKSVRMLGGKATNRSGGIGGGSGGTILLFLQSFSLGNNSIISSNGGNGCPNGGGGGGGGRVHFHWSFITTGDRYLPVANVKGNLSIRLGFNFLHFFSFVQYLFKYFTHSLSIIFSRHSEFLRLLSLITSQFFHSAFIMYSANTYLGVFS